MRTGKDASEYAEIGENRNGYPILKALKPNDDKKLFLVYAPDYRIETTAEFRSESIALTINPVKLSSVTVEGSFDTFYLNDGPNETEFRGLPLPQKMRTATILCNRQGKMVCEENDGITVDESTGEIPLPKQAPIRFMPL